MQLKQIRCGLVVVWTTLQSYLLISSSEMKNRYKSSNFFPRKSELTKTWFMVYVLNSEFFLNEI